MYKEYWCVAQFGKNETATMFFPKKTFSSYCLWTSTLFSLSYTCLAFLPMFSFSRTQQLIIQTTHKQSLYNFPKYMTLKHLKNTVSFEDMMFTLTIVFRVIFCSTQIFVEICLKLWRS